MSDQLGDVDALITIQDLILNRLNQDKSDTECIDDIILLLRDWQNEEPEEEEEEEEKPTEQMWTIEVPVIYTRTYWCPGEDAEAALEFFHNEGGNTEGFTDYSDDVDYEDTCEADVIGHAPSWIHYRD